MFTVDVNEWNGWRMKEASEWRGEVEKEKKNYRKVNKSNSFRSDSHLPNIKASLYST